MIDQKKLLAEKLKAFRIANNLTQTDFADECGISKDTLSLLERGKLNTTIDTLDLLTARMNIEFYNLFRVSNDAYYILISKEITVNEITRTTYGIGIVKDDELIKQIHDISLNYSKMKGFVHKCNTLDVYEREISELVDDIID